MFWTSVTCQTWNAWSTITAIFAGIFAFYTSFIQFTFTFVWSKWVSAASMTCKTRNTWCFVTAIFTIKFCHFVSFYVLRLLWLVFGFPILKIQKYVKPTSKYVVVSKYVCVSFFFALALTVSGFAFGRVSEHKTDCQHYTLIEAQSSKFARHPAWRKTRVGGSCFFFVC